MNILIKKCCKKFISFVLIFTISLPFCVSYASSADPSSFITKAEFDKALADFNTRLTVFEAGINSKIDSQVTTYLDRNGIWSGKYQELDGWTKLAAEGEYTATSKWNTGCGNYALLKDITDTKSLSNWMYQYGFASAFNSKNLLAYPIIKKINKSGLLCFTIETKPQDSSGRSGFISMLKYNYSSTGGSFFNVATPNITVDLVWSEENSTLTALPATPSERGRIRMTTGDFTVPRGSDMKAFVEPSYTPDTYYAFVNFHIALGKQNVYFFVTKGNSLWAYYNFIMSYKSTNNRSAFSSYKDSGGASSGNSSLYLTYNASACVY